MIGIVVVSHSRPLAEAAVALALTCGTAGGDLRVAVAAGVQDGAELGTDAAAVAQAIASLDSPDGVLVLMDLGSAVLSAQLAVELLDGMTVGPVRLSPAPLVEGLVAAAACAAAGADLDTVAVQALNALAGKQELLGVPDPGPATRPPARPVNGRLTRDVPVNDPIGLHLRSASALAALVSAYDAQVRVAVAGGRGPVAGDSLTDLLTLGAQPGAVLHLEARGPEAAEVLEAVAELAAGGFGAERSA